MKKLIALFLSLSFVICPAAPGVFAENDDTYATREKTISAFVEAIGIEDEKIETDILASFADGKQITQKYNKPMAYAVSTGLLKGYEDNTLRPTNAISRTEALVILRRALEGTKFYTIAESRFSDIPEWAESEINDLAGYGILKGYGDGTYGAEDFITEEQVDLLVSRLPEKVGPKADYYTYVNGNWLNTEELPKGYPSLSNFDETSREILNETAEIIIDLVSQQQYGKRFEQGTNEQKIVDIFTSSYNERSRNLVGTEPIRGLLEAIESVKTLPELMNVMADMGVSGFPSLISLYVNPDLMDAKKFAVYLASCYTGLSVDMIRSGDFEDILTAYEEYIGKLAKAANVAMSGEEIAQVANFCKELASASLRTEDMQNPKELYHQYSMQDMEKLFDGINFDAYIDLWQLGDADYVVVLDEELAKTVNTWLKKENLSLLKNYLKACVLDYSSQYLTTEMFDIQQEFGNKINGANAQYSAQDTAISVTTSLLGAEIADLYLKANFSDETKQYAEELVEDVLDMYEQRLQNNTWLEEQTQNAAIEKLNNILVQVGYPEYIKGYRDDNFQVRSLQEGGSLLGYIIDYAIENSALDAYLITEDIEVSRDGWGMSPMAVNAAYSSQQNSIIIPAGILREPFFDQTASYGENLGAIGSIIAHEITHAFDSTGAQFDKDGNVADWWTEKDKQTFENICNQVIDYYQTFYIGDKQINGKLTLGENIADLGSMACVVEIAKEKNCDLAEVFESYARMWRMKVTPEYEKLLLNMDSHAPSRVRVNAVLSNTPEFAEYYQLVNGDGMYLPPAQQIVIW